MKPPRGSGRPSRNSTCWAKVRPPCAGRSRGAPGRGRRRTGRRRRARSAGRSAELAAEVERLGTAWPAASSRATAAAGAGGVVEQSGDGLSVWPPCGGATRSARPRPHGWPRRRPSWSCIPWNAAGAVAGRPVAPAQALRLTERTELELEGFGRLVVMPGGEDLHARQDDARAAEAALRGAGGSWRAGLA